MKIVLCIILFNILYQLRIKYDMLMLQQHSYNENNSYLKYIVSDYKKNRLDFYIKLVMGICLILTSELSKLSFILLVLFILILVYIENDRANSYNKKKPLKMTKRMIRIYALDMLIILISELLCFTLPFYSGVMLILIALSPIILMLALYMLLPVEKMIFNHYKKMALTKLNKMNGINIIGITGSFGKTSSKMILESILKTTYKGFYSPASFNTPNGLLMTINSQDTIFNEYFIAEMGAKRVNEIKELCDLVKPKYGILTSIGSAHLESFKTLKNIQKTKFELVESLPSDGLAILNKDDEYQVSYKIKNNVKTLWIGIQNDADVMAKNIKYTDKGSTFDVIIGKEKIHVQTVLLGEKNIYNILGAIALAKHLGVSNDNITLGVKNITGINHRLELKQMPNFTLIDDSFNSNPEGAKNALEVLKLMPNKKIIITPGMVEMGSEEYNLNFEFGRHIASVCDEVYLIGKKQTKPIYEGLKEEEYNEDNIKIMDTFNEAYALAIKNKKAVILIENDLPDSYNEVK